MSAVSATTVVVLPAYNEASNLADVIAELVAVLGDLLGAALLTIVSRRRHPAA